MDARRSIAVLCFGALLAPAAVMLWMGRDVPQFGYFQDDALYWIGAKSLGEGRGYRILSLPQPYFQTKYPPLYSLLLAGIWKFDPSFPQNLRWGLLLSWLMLPLYLLLARPLLRGLTDAPWWAPLGLMALSAAVIFLSINLLADFLFASLSFACLLAAERAAKKARGTFWPAAGGVLAGLAYLVKSAAVVLVPAVLTWMLLRRRWRDAALFAAAVLPPLAGWNYWVHTHRLRTADPPLLYYTDYLGFYLATANARDLPNIVVTNLASMIRTAGSLLVFHPGESIWAMLFSALLVGIAILGMDRRFTLYLLFCGLYSLLLVCWNFPPNERFLLPVFPLLAAGFCQTLRRLVSVPAVAAVVGGVLVWITFQTVPPILDAHRERRSDLAQAFQTVAHECSGPVIAYQDTLVYLYTGRPALRLVVPPVLLYRNEESAMWAPFRGAADYGRKYGAGCLLSTAGDYHPYITLSDAAERERILRSNPDFKLIFDGAQASVYRIR